MVVGHQGGWDEVLFVAFPILLGVWLLWLANKRAAAQLASEEEALRSAAPKDTSAGNEDTVAL